MEVAGLNLLDMFVLLYIFLSVIDGWRRGVYTLFNLLALILAGLFAKFWHPFMLSFLNSAFGFEKAITSYIEDLTNVDPQTFQVISSFLGAQADFTPSDIGQRISVLLAIGLSFIAAYIILRIIFLFFSGTASEMLSMRLLGVLVHLIISVVIITVVLNVLWAISFKTEGLRNLIMTSKVWPIVSYVNAIILYIIY